MLKCQRLCNTQAKGTGARSIQKLTQLCFPLDSWYNSQGIILNFKSLLLRCRRLSQICPVWIFPIILKHKYQELKNKHFTTNIRLFFSLTVSFPYLYLKDESALVEGRFHLKNADNLVKRTKQSSADSTPCRLLDGHCFLSDRGGLGICHVKCMWLDPNTPSHATVSGDQRQDESNPALWLATRAGKMELSCPLGTTRRVPQEKFPWKPYHKSFIDQVCSVKMAWYWPRFFANLWTSTPSRSINT